MSLLNYTCMRYQSSVHLPASLEHQAPRAPSAATDRIVQFFFVPLEKSLRYWS